MQLPVRRSNVGIGVGLAAVLLTAGASPAQGQTPTFSKDVAPIVYEKCAECHRPGSMAPMSLMTYEDIRPWARAVKQRVVHREMPPWGADPAYGPYANDPSLTEAQIDTIAAWVDGGAPAGDPAHLPEAPTFVEGWSIGEPDLVFTMLEPFTVPADGTVPYMYVTIPTNLKEDIWVRGVELKPSDRRVVHHIISDLVEGTGEPVDPTPQLTRDRSQRETGGLGGYVPGRVYDLFDEGVARRIPAGSEIVLQMHYTTIGEVVQDQTQIGVVLATEPPSALRESGGGQMPNFTFVIPPGAPNHEVTAQRTIERDTYLRSVYPHMHVRGKDVTYAIVHPDGREEIVLHVPKYDFNWQLNYVFAEPKYMPKGSILRVTAHYDNSAANRYNPDPSAAVRWGNQTWEEMLIGYYGTIDAPASNERTSSTGADQQQQ